MSLLKYSQTWPSILTSTMAVVQINVDPKGRPYSTIVEIKQQLKSDQIEHEVKIPEINIVSPFTSIETTESPFLNGNANNNCRMVNRLNIPNGGKFCYCTNKRGSTTSNNPHFLRSESIKVDNWDYIYTERRGTNGDLR